MTSYAWKGVSGDWDDPNNWTPAGGPPTSADDATIAGSPSADIITVDTADAANALTLSDPNATLDIDGASASLSVDSLMLSAGALNVSSSRDGGLLALNGGMLDQTGGNLILGRGGTISDGTIDAAGGAFDWQGGTLDDVTYEGALDLINSRDGHIADGLTMSGSSGSGPGTINVGGDSHLYFDGTQTLSNATVNLGDATTNLAYLRETDATGVGDQVLTLASNVTIDVGEASGGNSHAAIESGRAPGDGVVNDGAIDVMGANADLVINPMTFANNGTIDDFGDKVYIRTAVTGEGTDTIHYLGVLQFDAGVSTAATLGEQNIDFAGPNGPGTTELRLVDAAPTSFYGEISGFAAGDEINLAGAWAFSGVSEAGGMTMLTLSNGSTTHGFEFVGDYGESNFSITSGTTTKIAYV
jgi:hypothetical protein